MGQKNTSSMFQKTGPLGQQIDTAEWIPATGKASEATLVPEPRWRVTEAEAGTPTTT